MRLLMMGNVSVCLQMISVLVDKMIRTQIVDCAAVANWIFSPDMAHDFTRYIFIFCLYIFFFSCLSGSLCCCLYRLGQALCVGDSSLHHQENEQTCPEDPEGAGGGQGQAGKTAAQEGMGNFMLGLL